MVGQKVLDRPLRRLPEPPELLYKPGAEASWRSGDAADCKSVYTGSIPVEASIFRAISSHRHLGASALLFFAVVMLTVFLGHALAADGHFALASVMPSGRPAVAFLGMLVDGLVLWNIGFALKGSLELLMGFLALHGLILLGDWGRR